MTYRPGKNWASETLSNKLDREAVLGDYGTGNAEFDFLLKELNENRPDEREFVDVYGQEEVAKDLELVRRIGESPVYEKERLEGATAVEGVIAYGVRERGWLGRGAKVRLTGKFDDLTRGVDMLIELPHPDSTTEKKMSLGMAIDVTASSDVDVIEKKIASSIQRLDRGKNSRGNPGGQLTTLKYMFRPNTENPKFDKSKRKYNHYIVALDGLQAKELAKRFCSEEDDSEKSFLELEAQIKVIYLIRHQAYLQLGEVMDKYCGSGQHVLFEYRKLPEDDKDNFEALFDFVYDNLPLIENHLKEKWSRKSFDRRTGETRIVEEDNSEMVTSIKKNIAAIRYLEGLLMMIVRNKKEAETITADADRNGFIDDPGARHILSYGRSDVRTLSDSLHPPRVAGNG